MHKAFEEAHHFEIVRLFVVTRAPRRRCPIEQHASSALSLSALLLSFAYVRFLGVFFITLLT